MYEVSSGYLSTSHQHSPGVAESSVTRGVLIGRHSIGRELCNGGSSAVFADYEAYSRAGGTTSVSSVSNFEFSTLQTTCLLQPSSPLIRDGRTVVLRFFGHCFYGPCWPMQAHAPRSLPAQVYIDGYLKALRFQLSSQLLRFPVTGSFVARSTARPVVRATPLGLNGADPTSVPVTSGPGLPHRLRFTCPASFHAILHDRPRNFLKLRSVPALKSIQKFHLVV